MRVQRKLNYLIWFLARLTINLKSLLKVPKKRLNLRHSRKQTRLAGKNKMNPGCACAISAPYLLRNSSVFYSMEQVRSRYGGDMEQGR